MTGRLTPCRVRRSPTPTASPSRVASPCSTRSSRTRCDPRSRSSRSAPVWRLYPNASVNTPVPDAGRPAGFTLSASGQLTFPSTYTNASTAAQRFEVDLTTRVLPTITEQPTITNTARLHVAPVSRRRPGRHARRHVSEPGRASAPVDRQVERHRRQRRARRSSDHVHTDRARRGRAPACARRRPPRLHPGRFAVPRLLRPDDTGRDDDGARRSHGRQRLPVEHRPRRVQHRHDRAGARRSSGRTPRRSSSRPSAGTPTRTRLTSSAVRSPTV